MVTIATIHQFIISLGFSIIVETAVLWLLLRYIFKNRELQISRIVSAGVFATFATISYVWFVFPNALDWPRSTAIIYGEVFVIIVESVFYRLFLKTSWGISFGVAIAANLASYLLGPFLRAHDLWIYW